MLPDALEHVAPGSVHKIFEEAIGLLFDGEPLPEDRERREERIGQRYDRIESQIDRLESEFFAEDHLLDAAMHAFAASHSAEFSKALRPAVDQYESYRSLRAERS